MKVIIAGSRSFCDYASLSAVMKDIKNISEVVCGCAPGTDELGKKWANEHNIKVTFFPAEWNIYGKAAGTIRNHKMGDYADYLVAFWDGKSKGTKDMIDYMKRINKHGKVVLF